MPELDDKLIDEDKTARLHRLRNVFIIAPIVVGVFFLIYFNMRYDYLSSLNTVIPLTLFGLSASVMLMRYLQTGTIFKQATKHKDSHDRLLSGSYLSLEKNIKNQKEQVNNLNQELRSVIEKIAKLESVQGEMTSEQKDSIVNSLKVRLKDTASEELLSDLQEKVSNKLEQDNKLEAIDQRCSETVERLINETSALGRRGNLNLVLGILTTLIGLFVLYIYVSNIKVDLNTPWLAIINFLPRLSLVILIELFAYFFLKLYKSNLTEIKYFQNELTNIESKYHCCPNVWITKQYNLLKIK